MCTGSCRMRRQATWKRTDSSLLPEAFQPDDQSFQGIRDTKFDILLTNMAKYGGSSTGIVW